MTFMMKKKRFKFHVNFEIEELSSVPFVSGVLFAKLRLQDGGSFTKLSPREEVCDHRVRWADKFAFSCKMTAGTNGVLDPCLCRISVRKEVKGGKSFQKLGFADINLAEFAGSGLMSRRFLLEGYDSKTRQDNSTLKVNIDMSILSGDPCFKAPQPHSNLVLPSTSVLVDELQPEENKAADEYSEDSLASGSSGFESLPRKNRTSLVTSDLGGSEPDMKKVSESSSSEPCHMRTGSHVSQQSKVSGYSSSVSGVGGHSRQSSLGSVPLGHTRNESVPKIRSPRKEISPSTGSSRSDKLFGSIGRHKKLEQLSGIERRVDHTRVDAEELIDELIKQTDFQIDESAETSGLQLFIAKDGTTALGSQQIRAQAPAGKYEQVVIEPR